MTMSDCELAYTSFDTPTRVFVCNRVELLNDGTIHPTQKPVKLYSWVLSLFARKGMKILDTHAGSGSSLIACYRQGGLDFVGFEIDEDYYRAAKEAGGRRLHRRKSGASSGGGLHVGSLYAYVRRYACRVRRSLFSSGLEREQRREIRIRRSNGAEQAVFLLRRLGEGARRNEQIRIHDRENRQDRFSMLRMRKIQRLSGNTRRR